MKYTSRFIHYAGVILLALGMMFAAPSPITTAIAGGVLSYLPLSVVVWLLFGVFLARVSSKPVTRIRLKSISLLLLGIGAGVLVTGAALGHMPVTETGVFLLLVGIEFHVTRHEWNTHPRS